MFEERTLAEDVAAVRERHAPDALVLDCGTDFETLPPAQAEDLGLLAESLDPLSYPDEWLPADAPELLRRFASTDFTIGMPGDGSVAWTRQTVPPTVFVKARVQGSPEDFVDFLVAEALVEAGADLPEHFLGFFRTEYRDFAAAAPHNPHTTYQLAVAICEAYRGLHTRATFETWPEKHPALGDAWADAGERLADRVDDLPGAVARGETQFADAAELACAGVKHGIDVPAPFGALDTIAFREHGASFAVRWAEKLFE